MITKAISESENISQLSPKALSLFCLLIPHFNAHGKMKAGNGYIKDLVCPLVPWLSQASIPKLLKEISEHTSVKYFKNDKGLPYLQSLNWHNHQKLEEKKLGTDELPNYSDTYKEVGDISSTKDGEVALEVEGEGKEEVEDKKKGKGKTENLTPADLIEGWNKILGSDGLSKVTALSDDRKKKIMLRLKVYPEIDWWKKVFNKIRVSKFLMGRTEGDRKWKANFDWLVANDQNPLKVYEGQYDE